MDNLDKQKKKIKELVDTFEFNIEQYKSKNYDEANTRVDFIDKLFECLGWDVRNTENLAEQYRQVVREDKVKIQGKQKAPDYSFRIYGQRKFFVEAKKPSVNIYEDSESAYQVRRYGYTAKLPLSILTNFEGLAVYDTRIKPNKNDKSSIARINYYTYKDYLDKFDELYNLFSINSILKGSFDKYVIDTKNKKGTGEVDKEFLKVIDEWRVILARNVALRNKDLTIDEINYAIQKIIDRIIFLRISEDRKTEEYKQLYKAVDKENSYQSLDKIFKKAYDKYNSSIFQTEDFISNLKIDDNTLKSIIKEMYYPDCPYEFSVLPIEILGNIYEQFLGKTIRLTPSHQAKIEEKPEVKKAGGVYYTPQYIVDYIVKNTLGQKLEELSKKSRTKDKLAKPDDIQKLKILDPSCGSGSFLIGAYGFLLNYHLNYYTANKTRLNKAVKEGKVYQISPKEYKLTIKEKQNILRNNIFGVDIDRQAVEVTKLSLLLKLMEDEREEYFGYLFNVDTAFKLLPDLSDNIKCGNSLIGSDIYDTIDIAGIDDDTIKSINPFDWEEEFPDIMSNGGFDCVIGNPPYIRIQTMQDFNPLQVSILKRVYKSASSGNIDIYVTFLEKALQLINKNGISGYILPHKFFQAEMGENIRNIIAETKAISQIVNFDANQIFENATTYTCLFFMTNTPTKTIQYKHFELGEDIKNTIYEKNHMNISSDILNNPKWRFHTGIKDKILEKFEKMPVKLKDITRKIFQGIATGRDKIFILKRIYYNLDLEQKTIKLYSKELDTEIEIETELLKPFLMGKDVKRYIQPIHNNYVIFPYIFKDRHFHLMDKKHLIKNFPLGWEYLKINKTSLESREKGRFKENWWCYSRPQNLTEFENEKILTPEISLGCNMTISKDSIYYYHTTKVYSIVKNNDWKLKNTFLLSILNSNLLWFYLKNTGYILRGGYFTFKTKYLENFPIPNLDLSKSSDKKKHDELVSLVDNMLETQKKLQSSKTEADKKLYQKKANAIDKKIDSIVYELYGLTDEEIKIVEESVNK